MLIALHRDARQPLSRAAHARVVPDVLQELVTSCEGLLRERGWTNAQDELARGDSRHREGNWTDAVSASSLAFGKNTDLWVANFAIGPPGGPGPALLLLDAGVKAQPLP